MDYQFFALYALIVSATVGVVMILWAVIELVEELLK